VVGAPARSWPGPPGGAGRIAGVGARVEVLQGGRSGRGGLVGCFGVRALPFLPHGARETSARRRRLRGRDRDGGFSGVRWTGATGVGVAPAGGILGLPRPAPRLYCAGNIGYRSSSVIFGHRAPEGGSGASASCASRAPGHPGGARLALRGLRFHHAAEDRTGSAPLQRGRGLGGGAEDEPGRAPRTRRCRFASRGRG
jgi:hypothetical protein